MKRNPQILARCLFGEASRYSLERFDCGRRVSEEPLEVSYFVHDADRPDPDMDLPTTVVVQTLQSEGRDLLAARLAALPENLHWERALKKVWHD